MRRINTGTCIVNGESISIFNDVLLNLIGGAIGVIAICGLVEVDGNARLVSSYSLRNRLTRPLFLIVWSAGACALALSATSWLRLYRPDQFPHSAIFLSRIPWPEELWTRPTWGSKTFHVVQPLEGSIILAVLIASYILMDYKLDLAGRLRSSAALSPPALTGSDTR